MPTDDHLFGYITGSLHMCVVVCTFVWGGSESVRTCVICVERRIHVYVGFAFMHA